MNRTRRRRPVRSDAEADALIDRLVAPTGLRALFQPIVRITDGEIVGYEGLCRSVKPERRQPAEWFELASALDDVIEEARQTWAN